MSERLRSLFSFELIAVVLAAMLVLWGEPWSTLIGLSIGGVLIVAYIFSRNLPRAIRKSMAANCRRSDGTRSPYRCEREAFALRSFRRKMATLLMVVVFPTAVLVWTFDREVIPISLGIDAIGAFRVSESEWKKELLEEEQAFEEWKRDSLGQEREAHKRFLWNWWPALLAGGLIWIIGCCVAIKTGSLQLLRDLSVNINQRAREYRMKDLGRTMDAERECGREGGRAAALQVR